MLVAVGESLTKLGAPAGRGLLQKSLSQDRYPQVQLQAALALREQGDAAAQTVIASRLSQAKPTDDSRIEILSRKAQIGDGEAKTQLIQILPDGVPSLPRQIKVASLLAALGDDRARGLLSDVAVQPGALQVTAAHALCLLEGEFGQSVLRTTLWATGTGMPQRILAAQGIGHCGDKQDAAKLSQVLRTGERSGILRQAEAGALLKLCDGDPLVLAERSFSVRPNSRPRRARPASALSPRRLTAARSTTAPAASLPDRSVIFTSRCARSWLATEPRSSM